MKSNRKQKVEIYLDEKDYESNNKLLKNIKLIIVFVVISLIILFVSLIICNDDDNIGQSDVNNSYSDNTGENNGINDDKIDVSDNQDSKTFYLELNGYEEVTIYLGTDYIEQGYKAYDSLGNDLTNEVDITSNLNINKIGVYEIIYSFGEITKVRKVIILETPRDFTYIRLNQVNNNDDIVLMVGDTYVEPGYYVETSSNKNLGKVKVTGYLDTNKEGEYTLVYSINDPYGNLVYAIRKVFVVDIKLDYSLNINSYTNENIIINLKVNAVDFDYMILPNNKRVDNSKYAYEVYENGNYQVNIYNKYGHNKKFNILVDNIDKSTPVGSCNVTHNENGSIINISANDNIGIVKYVYNGNEYKNRMILLDNYISDNVFVSFYDSAGNVGSATCYVEKIPAKYLIDSSHYSYNNGINDADVEYVDVSDLSCTIVNYLFNVDTRIKVHKSIADNFHGILGLVCDYVNETPWIEQLQHAGAYANREIKQHDYHSKGLAIDLNNSWTYTYNGKTYKPYSWQGVSTWEDYNEFICDVCDGKEDCPYNVNYVIFKRYFEGNGWCWGGNYSPEWFDPMHYELRDYGICSVNKQSISC